MFGKNDKYGYLQNPEPAMPNPGSSKKPWLFGGAAVALTGLGVYLYLKSRSDPIAASRVQADVLQYTVTAPSSPLEYSGAGMPYGIEYYEPVPDYHWEVDQNGVGRIVADDGRYGGIFIVRGNYLFVDEAEMNIALEETRLANSTILLKILPYSLVSSGYTGYITSGRHIGEVVFITLTGQVGKVLYSHDGEEMYVPMDLIDQNPNIWETFVKPSGGVYEY